MPWFLLVDVVVLAILARLWYVYGKGKGLTEGQRLDSNSYAVGWEAGFEAAEEAEDKAVLDFEYDWKKE